MKRNLLILFFIGFAVFGLSKTGLFGGVGSFFDHSTQGIQLSFYAASRKIAGGIGTIFQIGSLRKENASLEEKVALLESENGVLKKLEAENKTLKAELGLDEEARKNLMSAQVLGFSLAKSRGFLAIDKGKSDSLHGGEIVLLQDIVLGKVQDLRDHSSLVKLLTDPESKYLAETATKVRGVVIGDFGTQMKLTKVLLEDTLNIGDIVYTSGEEGMPKGLVVGKITKVKRLEAELFQEAEVEPMLTIGKLDLVFVKSN